MKYKCDLSVICNKKCQFKKPHERSIPCNDHVCHDQGIIVKMVEVG